MATPRLFPQRGFTPATKAAAQVMPAPLFWLDGNPWRNDTTDTDAISLGTAFGASSLVYACMTFRARKLAEAPLWITDEKDGNESWLAGTVNHPLADLLEQPNPDQTAAQFIAELSIAMDLGPTLVVKNRDRAGRVVSLYVFGFDQFTVKPGVVDGTLRKYGAFTVTDANGRQTPVDAKDVLHFPVLGGVSPLDAALAHVRISDTMRQAVKSSLAKSMRPGSVTSVEGQLQDDAFQRFKAQLGMLYAGADNTGRNLVLDAGAKFTQLAASLKDLELGPVQGDVEAAICQAFAIHPALVGAKIALENSSGLSDSLKPALSLFYDLCAFPRWAEIETAFTAGLLREVDDTPARFVRFVKDDVRALAPDLLAAATVAKQATGILKLDEQRAMLAAPPLGGAAGDAIAPAAGTGQAPNDGQPPNAANDTQKSRRAAYTTKAARLASDAERAAFWAEFDTKAQAKTPKFERTARRLFAAERMGVLATLRAAQRKAATDRIERKDDTGGTAERLTEAEIAALFLASLEGPALDAAALQIAADYAADGPYAQAWADEMGTLIKTTMQGAAEEFSASVGITFNMDDPALIRAIRDRAAALVQHVTDTTQQAIADAIATGKAEGLTIEQIAKRVDEQAFGAMAKARAKAIASTEVGGALNDARWTAATSESSPFQSKRWIHTRRPGDRKYHDAHEHEGPHDGWVPMAYEYTAQNGMKFARPFAPGLPASEVVHCACVMAYSDAEPAQAAEEN